MREQNDIAIARLEALYRDLCKQGKNHIGYLNSLTLNNQTLSRFLDLPIENTGNPFNPPEGINTCELEADILNFYKEIYHQHDDVFWGCATKGAAEGNLCGLYMARDRYPDGFVYYSADSHPSIPKITRMLRMVSVEIKSNANGELDYNHFHEQVCRHRNRPIIVVANIGSYVCGAIDQVESILDICKSEYIDQIYIHCDAALMGNILPFLSGAPVFDFQLPIGSISVTGQFLGTPMPCGVVVSHLPYSRAYAPAPQDIIGTVYANQQLNNASYMDILGGARDGFSALVMWHNIQQLGIDGLAERADSCLGLVKYTLWRLKEIRWPAMAHDYSNIVIIDRPHESLIRKWQLATWNDKARLVLMPGIEQEMIDRLIEDLRNSVHMDYHDTQSRRTPLDYAA